MLSLIFGPCPERQGLCAALDIPLAQALSEECDCQAISIVEMVFWHNNLSSRIPSQNQWFFGHYAETLHSEYGRICSQSAPR